MHRSLLLHSCAPTSSPISTPTSFLPLLITMFLLLFLPLLLNLPLLLHLLLLLLLFSPGRSEGLLQRPPAPGSQRCQGLWSLLCYLPGDCLALAWLLACLLPLNLPKLYPVLLVLQIFLPTTILLNTPTTLHTLPTILLPNTPTTDPTYNPTPQHSYY